jgi:hypothetical protein
MNHCCCKHFPLEEWSVMDSSFFLRMQIENESSAREKNATNHLERSHANQGDSKNNAHRCPNNSPRCEEEDHNSTLYCSYIKITYQCEHCDKLMLVETHVTHVNIMFAFKVLVIA